MATLKLTKRIVEAAQPATVEQDERAAPRDAFLFDSEVKGFGLRVKPSGVGTYFVQYRQGAGGRRARKVRFFFGRHGQPWTVERARRQAKLLLAGAATGSDPITERNAERVAMTVAELCDLYLEKVTGLVQHRHGRPKKPSTLATDRGRIARHIKPLLGGKRVKDLTTQDVERFQEQVAIGATKIDVKTGKHGRARVTGGPGTAARTVGLLGGILSFAVRERIRPDNPVRGVARYKDQKRERFLSAEELARLGDALATAEHDHPAAIAVIRFLALTGLRRSEALTLRWEHVDQGLGILRLADSKTGARIVTLGKPALGLLNRQLRLEGNPYVFPGERRGHHLVGLPKVWRKVREQAGLAGVRLHDLRHGYASVAASSGTGLFVVAKLLGHTDLKSTLRYAHLADDPVKSAADRTASSIEAQMTKRTSLSKVLTFPEPRG